MSARWRTGLVVLGAALALAGCSSGGSDTPAAETGSSQSSGTTSEKPAKERAVEEQPADGALEAFVADQQSSIPAVMEASPGVYSDVAIEATAPSTIVFSYVYAEAVDVPSAAAYLDTMVSTLQSACDAQVFPAMEAAGVSDPQAVYTYLNPDGSEVWTHTFAGS
jgi:hypothetical protein